MVINACEICTCCSVCFVAVQSVALVVWPLLSAPFFAALAPVGEWNTHFELFLLRTQSHHPRFFGSFWRCLQQIRSIFFFEDMRSMAFFLISSAASLSSDFFLSLAEKLSSFSHNSSMSASFSDNSQSMPLACSSSHCMVIVICPFHYKLFFGSHLHATG